MTAHEYSLLESYLAIPNSANAPLVDYVFFCEAISQIFTDKSLEKNPTKTLSAFKAPSILDPKQVLSEDEERALDSLLQRLGTHVRHHRLLIKPFF